MVRFNLDGSYEGPSSGRLCFTVPPASAPGATPTLLLVDGDNGRIVELDVKAVADGFKGASPRLVATIKV
jgi:hypothetical protein